MTAKRRVRGEGSIYYSKTAKRWETAVSVTDPETGKSHRVKRTGRTRKEVSDKLVELLHERRKTGMLAPGDYTTGQAIAAHMKHPPATWRSPATRQINALHARRLTAALGTVPLAKLTPAQIERHLRAEITRPKRPLSASTVRDELFLLRAAIEQAERDGKAGRNPARLARMPAGAHTRRSESMTPEQVSALLSSDLSPLWRAWVTTAVALGLRPGELAALAWEDVGDDGVLRVRRSLKAGVRGELKTERSRRSLQMPQAVISALTAWRAEQLTQQLACPTWAGSGLVFTDGFGRPLNRQKIQYGFRKVCAAAGVARRDGTPFQPRELRHTATSLLSDAGVDIEQIADVLGHVNSNVTRTVYRHQIRDEISAAAEVMDTVLGTEAAS
jgi:integrase